MSLYHNRPTVADMRAMKALGQKITMIYVKTLEEAAAAAGINMLHLVTLSSNKIINVGVIGTGGMGGYQYIVI